MDFWSDISKTFEEASIALNDLNKLDILNLDELAQNEELLAEQEEALTITELENVVSSDSEINNETALIDTHVDDDSGIKNNREIRAIQGIDIKKPLNLKRKKKYGKKSLDFFGLNESAVVEIQSSPENLVPSTIIFDGSHISNAIDENDVENLTIHSQIPNNHQPLRYISSNDEKISYFEKIDDSFRPVTLSAQQIQDILQPKIKIQDIHINVNRIESNNDLPFVTTTSEIEEVYVGILKRIKLFCTELFKSVFKFVVTVSL